MGNRKLAPPATVTEAEAKRAWSELQAEYAIVDPGGLVYLNDFAVHFHNALGAERIIARDGLTVVDRFSQLQPHPMIRVARDARAAMRAALKALNLDLEPLNARPGRPAGR